MSLRPASSHSHSLRIDLPAEPPGITPLGKQVTAEHKHDHAGLPHQHLWTIKEEGVSTKLYSYEEQEAVAFKEG